MGLFDDLKKASTKVAGEMKTAATTIGQEAGKQGRVAQAQLKLRSLQGEVGEAEKALGGKVYDLAERGEIAHPELSAEMDTVREARAAVTAKEAEIEAIKAEEAASGATPAAAEAPAYDAADASTSMPGAGGADMPGTGSADMPGTTPPA
jgi:hypothetical protein